MYETYAEIMDPGIKVEYTYHDAETTDTERGVLKSGPHVEIHSISLWGVEFTEYQKRQFYAEYGKAELAYDLIVIAEQEMMSHEQH